MISGLRSAERLDGMSPGIRLAMLRLATPEEQFNYILFGAHDVPDDVAQSAMGHAAISKFLVSELPVRLQQLHAMLHDI